MLRANALLVEFRLLQQVRAPHVDMQLPQPLHAEDDVPEAAILLEREAVAGGTAGLGREDDAEVADAAAAALPGDVFRESKEDFGMLDDEGVARVQQVDGLAVDLPARPQQSGPLRPEQAVVTGHLVLVDLGIHNLAPCDAMIGGDGTHLEGRENEPVLLSSQDIAVDLLPQLQRQPLQPGLFKPAVHHIEIKNREIIATSSLLASRFQRTGRGPRLRPLRLLPRLTPFHPLLMLPIPAPITLPAIRPPSPAEQPAEGDHEAAGHPDRVGVVPTFIIGGDLAFGVGEEGWFDAGEGHVCAAVVGFLHGRRVGCTRCVEGVGVEVDAEVEEVEVV